MIKHPDKGNLMEKGFILPHSSRLQSIEVGKSRQQEPEASDHTMSHQKEQTMNKYLLLPPHFPHLDNLGLSTATNIIKRGPHTRTLSPDSKVMLDFCQVDN